MEKDVCIVKGDKEKVVSYRQWQNMVGSKATYGWRLSSELPDEVLQKESQLPTQNDEISRLKKENAQLRHDLAEAKTVKACECEGLPEKLEALKLDNKELKKELTATKRKLTNATKKKK